MYFWLGREADEDQVVSPYTEIAEMIDEAMRMLVRLENNQEQSS